MTNDDHQGGAPRRPAACRAGLPGQPNPRATRAAGAGAGRNARATLAVTPVPPPVITPAVAPAGAPATVTGWLACGPRLRRGGPAALVPAALVPAALLLAALLAGCGAPLLPAPASIELPRPPAEAPPPATLILPDETAPLLAYHQQVRRMAQGELLQELAILGQRPPSARVALQMGMVLMWTRGAGDLARAQAQFDSVAASSHALAPLAALLSAQCQEQRRLAEHGERQLAQLKESQRKIDQLTETLESLKAIERNLPARGNSNERQR